ncbi:MAG TPA: AmmeMemoRadiSam system protein B [Gammaproteobacteria bacterium]|nr:AmmeMemoRadiSam system protein B [Gammaproteobacteria bacterium]
MTTDVRPPAVAGSFYPRDPAQLAQEVDAYLEAAPARAGAVPKAIIVPHAGYVYSGPIAASAYRALAPARHRIRRVVLLGPAHRVAVRGLALPGAAAFATPLGEVAVDRALVERVRGLPQVLVHPRCHAPEHSLEVQLPFLQRVLEDFTLLPLVVGQATASEVAEVLRAVWGGPETLIVISSDLSHYLPYPVANEVDRSTVGLILDGQPSLTHDQACGATPVNGLLTALREEVLEAELVDLRNSGDTAGPRDRVVGYVAVLFGAPAMETQDEDTQLGRALVELARDAIDAAVGGAAPRRRPRERGIDARLDAAGAVFVTLKQDGRLRGCIGSLEASRPLREDVAANAIAAALEDPRFAPLAAHELAQVSVEVSLLSAPEAMLVSSEAEALAALRPGRDGIVLTHGVYRATFLPQVWAQLPTPREFLAQLKRKAGLPVDFWTPDMKLARYGVRKWSEA